MIRFDDIQVGATFGRHELLIDDTLLAAWARVFPEDSHEGAPIPGLVAVITMRAYAEVVTPRPPGNVHGAQRFDIDRLPGRGERVFTTVSCAGKAVKRERKWIDFRSETRDEAGEPCFTGVMTIAWAA